MKKIIWGVVLLVLGVLFVASAGENPDGPAPSIVMGLLSLGGGGALLHSGRQQRARNGAVVNLAFRMVRESSRIRAQELADAVGIAELEVRQHIADAQRAGLLPLAVEIV